MNSAFDSAIQDGVGHDPQPESVTDAVGENDTGNHDVCRESTGNIIPVDLRNGADHDESDDDQCGRGGESWDCKEDGGTNQRYEEEESCDHGCESGSCSGFDPDGRFRKCGSCTCSEDDTCEGCNGVRNQDFFDSGDGSVLFHKGCIDDCAADRTDGIKEIGKEEINW